MTLDFHEKILKLKDFNDAFELVKAAVETKFNMHRAGLSLILQSLPSRIGAYHILGSNVNNSYLFMVLKHEYLHSLGIVDEQKARQMTYDLCSTLLGKQHPSTLMAKEDPFALFPQLNLISITRYDDNFEVVKNFDKRSQSYIY